MVPVTTAVLRTRDDGIAERPRGRVHVASPSARAPAMKHSGSHFFGGTAASEMVAERVEVPREGGGGDRV